MVKMSCDSVNKRRKNKWKKPFMYLICKFYHKDEHQIYHLMYLLWCQARLLGHPDCDKKEGIYVVLKSKKQEVQEVQKCCQNHRHG